METSMIEKMRQGRAEAITRRMTLAMARQAETGPALLQKAREGRLEALCARRGQNIILFRGLNRMPTLQLTPALRVHPHLPMPPAPTHYGAPYLVQ